MSGGAVCTNHFPTGWGCQPYAQCMKIMNSQNEDIIEPRPIRRTTTGFHDPWTDSSQAWQKYNLLSLGQLSNVLFSRNLNLLKIIHSDCSPFPRWRRSPRILDSFTSEGPNLKDRTHWTVPGRECANYWESWSQLPSRRLPRTCISANFRWHATPHQFKRSRWQRMVSRAWKRPTLFDMSLLRLCMRYEYWIVSNDRLVCFHTAHIFPGWSR